MPNYLKFIFGNLIREQPPTLLKIKYLTLYHLFVSLKKLQNIFYPTDILTEQSKLFLKDILGDKDLKGILSQQKFRNALMHYKLDGIPESELSIGSGFYGFVEYYFDGMSYVELSEVVDNQIARLSDILEEWLGWPIESRMIKKW